MAYSCPQDLNGFMPHLTKVDIKFRQQVGSDLLRFLEDAENDITCQDIGQFVDNLLPWIQNSNFKVSRNGIKIMTQLVDRLGTDFRPYVPAVLSCVVDRLGDSRDPVRDSAQLLLSKLVERDVLSAQSLLDRLTPAFAHKNAKVREEVLRCLVTILNEYGARAIALSKVIPHVVKLVSDPAGPVRDAALSTIVDVYKHVGERLRQDIQRRNLVPAAKLPALLARLDEVLVSGELLPTAKSCAEITPLACDEVDRIPMMKPAIPVKKAGLALAVKKGPLKIVGGPSGMTTSGAVDEDTFIRSFEDVPAIQIFSSRELCVHMKTIQEIIGDQNKEWNKRIDALKKIRSLVVAGAMDYSDFYTSLRNMDMALQASIRDLRSQVVREAAITIAYLAQSMGSKFDKTAELMLPHLINLIQNSVKIMATAGIVTIKFIIQHTQSPRLLPILTNFATTNKSKEIRRACCECLDLLLNAWPTSALERHIAVLQDALKKGIADADAKARLSSRKAFKGFRDHFPDQAESLLQSLDAGYRKALQGELSSSSSSGSLAQTAAGVRSAVVLHALPTPATSSRHFYAPRQTPSATAPGSTTGSTENLSITAGCLQRTPSLPRSSRQRSGIPVLSSATKKGFRSNSAIDLQAAQRARARAQYSVLARQKVATSNTASLPADEDIAHQARPPKIDSPTSMQSPERLSRTRSRGTRVSHSQPTSRSNSPSSKYTPYSTLGYHHHIRPHAPALTDTASPPIGRRHLASGIPRSTQGSRETSRETSPNRGLGCAAVGAGGRVRRCIDNRPPISPITKQPVMTQRILQQSREAESALADALIYDQLDSTLVYQGRVSSPRKGMRSLEHNSDDSETSSVCSERSYDSYRRASESYSWSGSQQRLANKDLWEPCKDINEIIALCASTTWQERKEGLVSLRHYLSAGKNLSTAELKCITDLFTRMFMDAHTKGLCVFLDTLNEIIRRYKTDLVDWLYILLQRIFHKVGTDILSSTIAKLVSTLDLVRASFPVPAQLGSIFRYLGDPAQTPSARTKIAVLNYLSSVCAGADQEPLPVEFGPTNSNKHTQQQAVGKIITWASSMGPTGGAELRQAAKTSIVSLWNLNTPAMTLLLSELSKEQQDIASNIVHSHMRNNITDSEPSSPLGAAGNSPPSLVGNKPLSHVMPQPRLLFGPGGDDPANSQEEIYKSLRRTTAEIQNYSYEALGGKLDRDRDTTSQDSGISQMSADNNNHHRYDVATIEERMEGLHLRSNYATSGNAAGSSAGPCSLHFAINGLVSATDAHSNNGYSDISDLNEDELVQRILVQCSTINNPTPEAEKRQLLLQLTKLFERGEVEPVIRNFKKVLRILLDNLNVQDSETRVTVLQILTEMLKTPAMKACWSNFIELLTVRVFNAYCDDSRTVVNTAESTAAAMSAFPFNTVLNTLSPLVRTGRPVAIQGAIRMLTKLIEMNAHNVTDEHLQALMPGLMSANDHDESSVRKAAVFCMVALHTAVGEPRFTPYTECLSGSKLKLLKLYLNRVPQSPLGARNRDGEASGGGSGGGNSNSAATGSS